MQETALLQKAKYVPAAAKPVISVPTSASFFSHFAVFLPTANCTQRNSCLLIKLLVNVISLTVDSAKHKTWLYLN